MQRRTNPAPHLEEFHERLVWARERSYPDVENATAAAKRFGWPVSTYLAHENGTRVPKKPTAEKYAAQYKVPAMWLIHGEGSMTLSVDPELVTLWGNLTPEDQEEIKRIMRRYARAAA